MFKIIAITLLVAAISFTSAHPQQAASTPPPVPIISQSQSDDGVGNFKYAFESGDGTKEEASGSLKSIKVPKVDEKGQIVGEQEGVGIVQQGKYR